MPISKLNPQINPGESEQHFWEENDPSKFLEKLEETSQFSELKPSTRTITLRVPEHLITNLKLIANKRDVPYQSLLKVFLQDKIKEEMQMPFLRFRRQAVKRTMLAVASLMLVGSLTYGLVVEPIRASGNSMVPNYPTNTFYLLDKFIYTASLPQRGDVVVFESPTKEGSRFFKRVVGLPGERVRISNGVVYINGNILAEPYAQGHTVAKNFPVEGTEMTVPGNSYYVLGDNRLESIDSRDFGFVSKDIITGKITVCYWNCQE